jgi:hypothetical protein
MTLESHLQKWWKRLSDDQRATLNEDAEQDQLRPSTIQLLLGTECPIGPDGTKWQADPEYQWSWPESVRRFIVAQ